MSYVEPLEGRCYLSAIYVSPNGTDAGKGTLSRPFQTIQHAADVARPGETVYIRAGTYHETVTVPRSGTKQKPITFTRYKNESVTIDGADPLSGFTTGSGSTLTTTSMTWNLGDGNNQLFLNGQPLTEAQWPNAPTSPASVFDQSFDIVTTASDHPNAQGALSRGVITSPNLTAPQGTYIGATIHISPGDQWAFQTGVVISSDVGTLSYLYLPFDGSILQPPMAGNRYYLTGVAAALDAPGEWFLDPATQQLSLIPPAAGFSGTVEAKHRLYGFDLSDDAYIHVAGINLFACTINTSSSSSHLLIDQLNARYVSQRMDIAEPFSIKDSPHDTGIMINGTGNILQNSTIQYSSGDGVFLGGSNNIVRNTTISDIDYAGGDETAVSVMGVNNRVTQNTIFNTGRSGIRLDTGADQVDHNRIYNVGLLTTDLGAIYTFGIDGAGSQIDYNIISGAHSGGFGSAGIYLDNNSSNYIVHHNVVFGADFALKMNPDSVNNRIYNNTLIGTQASVASSFTNAMPGSVFSNNIFGGPATIGLGATANDDFDVSVVSFVNAAAGNYLLRKGSAGIDKGLKLPPYTNGYVGKAPDIGAFEYKAKAVVIGRQSKRVK